MRLETYCVMCGKDLIVDIGHKLRCETTIAEILKPSRWIIQQNGENLDLYCSKKCAS